MRINTCTLLKKQKNKSIDTNLIVSINNRQRDGICFPLFKFFSICFVYQCWNFFLHKIITLHTRHRITLKTKPKCLSRESITCKDGLHLCLKLYLSFYRHVLFNFKRSKRTGFDLHRNQRRTCFEDAETVDEDVQNVFGLRFTQKMAVDCCRQV